MNRAEHIPVDMKERMININYMILDISIWEQKGYEWKKYWSNANKKKNKWAAMITTLKTHNSFSFFMYCKKFTLYKVLCKF